MTATTEPTLLEQLRALEHTAHILASERDTALAKAAESERRMKRAHHELVVADAVNQSHEWEIDDKNAEIRRLTAHNRELAVENEELRKQREQDQQEPKRAPKSVLSWRIGTRL